MPGNLRQSKKEISTSGGLRKVWLLSDGDSHDVVSNWYWREKNAISFLATKV